MNDTPAPAPAPWLEELADAVAACFVFPGSAATIGAHVQPALGNDGEQLHEVSLFLGATETLGGPEDGQRRHPSFWIDLARLRSCFERIVELTWQSQRLGPDDDLGAHIAIEGRFGGFPVRVHVLAQSPERFPALAVPEIRRDSVANRW